MFVCQALQQLNHAAPAGRIERRSRLIGQQNRRIAGECARNCHTLFLSPAQIGRERMHAVLQPHLDEQFLGHLSRFGAACASHIHGQCDIFSRRKGRKQIESLKHKADDIAPDARQFFFQKRADVFTQELQSSSARAQNATQNGKQRCFPAARWTHQQRKLPAMNVQVHVGERAKLIRTFAVDFRNPARADDRLSVALFVCSGSHKIFAAPFALSL